MTEEKLTLDQAQAMVCAGERPVDVFAVLAEQNSMSIVDAANLALAAGFRIFRADADYSGGKIKEKKS